MNKLEMLKKEYKDNCSIFVSLHSKTRHAFNEKLKADAAVKAANKTLELAADASRRAEVATANAHAEWQAELKRVEG